MTETLNPGTEANEPTVLTLTREAFADIRNLPTEELPAIRAGLGISEDAKWATMNVDGKELRVNVTDEDFGTVLEESPAEPHGGDYTA